MQQHQNLELAVDVFYVNGLKSMSGIERSIWNRTDAYLQNRNKDDFYKGVDAITIVYNIGGFTIEIIYIDIEFEPLIDKVEDELDIKLNYTNEDDHVP